MIVVSNTFPIINLAAVSHLNILKHLYSQILIAQAVYDEIVVQGQGLPGSIEVQTENWILKEPVKNINLLKVLETSLDKGEAETIALALEVSSDLVLLDEKLGRQKANSLNLKVTGILGILVEAKQKV